MVQKSGQFKSRRLARVATCAVGVVAASLAGCGETSRLSDAESHGPRPTLPEPTRKLLPTVLIAEARGWPDGHTPRAAEGLVVRRFAGELEHPRWLLVLPNGDVLVAETNGPDRPDEFKGIKGRIGRHLMTKAGAGDPSADRITLLRDADGDGVAELRSVLLEGLHSPFGMTLVGEWLYVANSDALVRFPYRAGDTRIAAQAERIIELPGGALNHHWTKNVVANPAGDRLYVTVGSNSNVGENGMDAEIGRAAIWEIDVAAGSHRIYASGLRNPNGLAFEPQTGQLWTVVNERDELGSDLVPDYLTSVRDGGFYGWPYSYYGQHVDERVQPQRPDLVAQAIEPDYALGNHTGSLGLEFARGETAWPDPLRSGAFVGQHGSWNRRPLSGYKVIFVPFADGVPTGAPHDVLTGFVDDEGRAYGRPVGVVLDARGGLLVADDVGATIWRVSRE